MLHLPLCKVLILPQIGGDLIHTTSTEYRKCLKVLLWETDIDWFLILLSQELMVRLVDVYFPCMDLA